jgi:thiol:disulfide interchange protein DsbD
MHSQQNQIPDLLQNQIQSRAQLGSEFTTEKPKTGEKIQTGVWLPYSERLLNESRLQGQPVFVDFTAAWCLSCQVNKRATLHANSVVEAFKQQNVITIEADWTNGDPIITEALARLHRNAVPVYVVYPANGGAPELLPEVLTPSLVIQALNRAAQKDTPK